MPAEGEADIVEMDDVSTITDETGASKEVEKPVSADSSTASDVSNTVADEDSLSVVRDVVDKNRPKAEAAASSATGEEDGGDPGDSEEPKEQDNENYSDVPFNKHPRFQEVLGKLKASEVDATRYRNVQNFIDSQGLSANEAADGLAVMGLMKTNPVEAWKRLQPTVQKLLVAAGVVLPDDLKARVQAGEISQEAALEVSRSRAAVQSVQVQQTFDQQRAETQRKADAAAALVNAAQAWESDRQVKDPNFAAKLPALQKEVAWLQATEGRPDTPDGVKAQLKKAYDAVNASQPAITTTPRLKPAITPVNGGQVNGSVRPAPKNTLDIIQSVVAARHA